jgi:hypothetical protein
LGTGRESEEMDLDLLRNRYTFGIRDYSVAIMIGVFER